MRSALTLLGILVGTASVVALLSSGELATQHALKEFKALGTNLLSVSIQSTGQSQQAGAGQGKQDKLTLNEVQQIDDSTPLITQAGPYTLNFGQMSYHGQPLQGSIIGVTGEIATVIKLEMASGRFISYLDNNMHYAVLGNAIASKLKSLGLRSPIGEQIRVGQGYFTVVGTLHKWPENMFMYADINNSIIIPISTSMQMSKYVNIDNIIFRLKQNANIPDVEKKLNDVMKTLLPSKKLFYRSPQELVASMQKQRETFTLMLGAIGGISLIVGGIGVMNIMLVSVIERRREIGVRMAVGARRRDIQLMFLTEAIILALFGGLIGVIVGVLVTITIAEISRWGFSLYYFPPLLGFVVSALVGIFFGFYPAYKASRLNPIDTLRDE